MRSDAVRRAGGTHGRARVVTQRRWLAAINYYIKPFVIRLSSASHSTCPSSRDRHTWQQHASRLS
jgi:hypothetical protein